MTNASDKDKCIEKVLTMGLTNDLEVKKLLEKGCKQVEPIMRKRKWHISLLTEFLPRNPGLLGLNEDRDIIKIRCRRPDKSLYDYESILETFLHELTHMECPEHDEAFHKLLKQLRFESDLIEKEGILPLICLSGGYRLSGHSHNPDREDLRKITAKAAESRKQISNLMSKPQKLGGAPTKINRNILAEAALKRLEAKSNN
jgi:hypothetical protein